MKSKRCCENKDNLKEVKFVNRTVILSFISVNATYALMEDDRID